MTDMTVDDFVKALETVYRIAYQAGHEDTVEGVFIGSEKEYAVEAVADMLHDGTLN